MWTIKLIQESEKAAIFSPQDSDGEITEFEKFMLNHSTLSEPQLKYDFDAIISAIGKILNDCGARDNLFRPEGRRIKAMPLWTCSIRKKNIGTLRLYCIRFSEKILIIGNGGIKKVQKYEEDPFLKSTVDTLRKIDKAITKKARKEHIETSNYIEFKNLLETITIS